METSRGHRPEIGRVCARNERRHCRNGVEDQVALRRVGGWAPVAECKRRGGKLNQELLGLNGAQRNEGYAFVFKIGS